MTCSQHAEFPHGVLPTRKNIMMYLLRPSQAGKAQRSKDNAAFLLAELLQEHWLPRNLYTLTTKNIKLNILKLYQEFVSLLPTRKQRQNENDKKKVNGFNQKARGLFNIFCEDAITRTHLEKHDGVKMTDMEWAFLRRIKEVLGKCTVKTL